MGRDRLLWMPLCGPRDRFVKSTCGDDNEGFMAEEEGSREPKVFRDNN